MTDHQIGSGIFGGSRHDTNFAEEVSTLIFNGNTYEALKEDIGGFDVCYSNHDYIVTATDGGKVTKKDNSYSLGNNFEFIEIDDDDEIKKEALRQYRKLIDKGIKKQDIVIITPMNKGDIGTIALNNEIQAEFNPPKPNELYLKRKYQTISSPNSVFD